MARHENRTPGSRTSLTAEQRKLTAWKSSGTVDAQLYLVERGERCLKAIEKRDIPAVYQDLDILSEPFPFKQELPERGAHDLPQRFQELSHRPGIDPERRLSCNLPDSTKESYFRHKEQGIGVRVKG